MFDVNTSTMDEITDVTKVFTNETGEYYIWIWTDSMRICLIVYLVVLLVVGLIGNLVALLGSIFHHAIKTDKISVVMLRDLAITDILLTIFLYIPLLSTLLAKRWVLGKHLCGLSHYAYEVLLLNKIVVIALISIYRLWLIKKPPSVKRMLSQNKCIVLCLVIPVICFIPQVLLEKFLNEASTFFDPIKLTCYGKNYYGEKAIWSLLILFPVLIVPIFIIIVTNIKLIVVLVTQARKTKRGFQKRRLFIAIKLIRLVIVITYMPAILFMIMQWVYRSDKDQKTHKVALRTLLFLNIVAPLNCAASPILYVLANSEFRTYLVTCGGLLEKDQWKINFNFSSTQRQTGPSELEMEAVECSDHDNRDSEQ